MIGNVLVTLLFLLLPAAVIYLCRKVSVLGRVGPVLLLYILGLIIGNTLHPVGMPAIQEVLSSAAVPVAIPLMLFACSFSRSGTRSQLLALVTGLVAVCISVISGFLVFGENIPEGAAVGGMLTGVYTGGTINMASIKTMLDVRDETFVLLNSYDMAISFLYLTFLMSVGVKLFRRFLTVEGQDKDEKALREAVDKVVADPYRGLFTRAGLKDAGVLIGLDAVIIAVSAGAGLLCGDKWFMTVLILLLTTLGIAASFSKKVRSRKYGYEIGMYAIYIFSTVVASMADLSKIDFSGGLGMLGYLTFVIFVSLLLQVIMARILKIDSDTMVISSVTYICSPPFVPMMAASMDNRRVLAPGLAIGVVGYAAGTYLGFLMYHFLSLL